MFTGIHSAVHNLRCIPASTRLQHANTEVSGTIKQVEILIQVTQYKDITRSNTVIVVVH